ncbi:MAG: hypothetical protein AAF639_14675 [Chloroflexota bacterium]
MESIFERREAKAREEVRLFVCGFYQQIDIVAPPMLSYCHK